MDFTFNNPAAMENAVRVHALAEDLRLIGRLRAPGIREIVDAPLIDDWSVGHRLEQALIGNISGHPLIPDGPGVTSGLHYLDPVAGFARTFTRWYRLGRQRVD